MSATPHRLFGHSHYHSSEPLSFLVRVIARTLAITRNHCLNGWAWRAAPTSRRPVRSFITPLAAAISRREPIVDMILDPDASTEHRHVTKDPLPANATLRSNNAMPPYTHIMGDLHEIIDFRAFTDSRVARGTAIDRRIGADLDIVLNNDAAELRHLGRARLARHVPKAILANSYTRMQQDAITQKCVLIEQLGAI